MSADERLELQKRLRIHKGNLAELQMTAAQYGFDKPLKLVNDIKHEEQQIAALKPRFIQLTTYGLNKLKSKVMQQSE